MPSVAPPNDGSGNSETEVNKRRFSRRSKWAFRCFRRMRPPRLVHRRGQFTNTECQEVTLVQPVFIVDPVVVEKLEVPAADPLVSRASGPHPPESRLSSVRPAKRSLS
jgi:hypothetical protein